MDDATCPHINEYGRDHKQWKLWQLIEVHRALNTWHLKRRCRRCGTIQTKREPVSIVDLNDSSNTQGPTGREAWIGIKKKVTA